ncbi:MAG: glycosyltransferase [Opitutales bacterium]|nr:glycosyltransferase [Opitutales bacterium]
MRISVVIPTWQRPEYLGKAFRGLANQSVSVDEVIVSVRKDDTLSRDWLEEVDNLRGLPVKTVDVNVPGVVASMQAGVDCSSGDIVCLLDDDAEPFEDWIKKILFTFRHHELIGAIGGRDLLMYLPPEERNKNLTDKVGVMDWRGRTVGNHHIGKGNLRNVISLKGCNCAFRGDLIRSIGFDENLRGADTQTHWETSLCFAILLTGHLVSYDPSIQVMHYVAPRHGPDQNFRGGYSPEGIFDQAHNDAYVYSYKFRGYKKILHHFNSTLVGSLTYPGLAQWLRMLARKDPNATEKFLLTLKGYWEGLKTARKLRKATSL